MSIGILTYLKIGAVAIILATGAFYVWNYHHMQSQITQLKEQNASLALGQQVILEAQKKAAETRQKVQVIVRRSQDENTKVQQEEMSGDDASLDSRLDQLSGVCREDKGSIAPGR